MRRRCHRESTKTDCTVSGLSYGALALGAIALGATLLGCSSSSNERVDGGNDGSSIADASQGTFDAASIPDGRAVVDAQSRAEAGAGDATVSSKAVRVSVASYTGAGAGACAVTITGGVVCWGYNGFGELGTGAAYGPSSTVPVQVSGLTGGALGVSVGNHTACAVTSVGGVVCWGYANDGDLGDGIIDGGTNVWQPVQVSGLASGVVAVSVGNEGACALTAAGDVECWGVNAAGQLGTDASTRCQDSFCTPVPSPIAGLAPGVTQVSTIGESTCAVTADGGVECWGANQGDQLGVSNLALTSSAIPVEAAGLTSGVTAVDMDSSCIIDSSGNVSCWGLDLNGADAPVPVPIGGITGPVVSLSDNCAVTEAGAVMCWTRNGGPPTATPVAGFDGEVASVSVSGGFGCAVLRDGRIECWGSNGYGQLGNGSTISSTTPVEVTGF